MSSPIKVIPTCRGCGRELIRYTQPHGDVYHPDTRDRCPTNFYGGPVCSRSCDVRACIEMESSMPGAGPAKRPGSCSQRQIDVNWPQQD